MDLKKVAEVVGALGAVGVPVNELSKNLLTKPSFELGEGLGDLFWLVLSPIHFARNAIEPRINNFRDELESKLAKIPKDQLTEPPLNIVGPTLEAAKYHLENEDIRMLFAQLIASSMDSSKQDLVHPSFVEIIKQLSPFDAKILSYIIENDYPIASIIAYESSENSKFSRSSTTLAEDIMPFPEMNLGNCHYYCSAIQNLERLSIIKVDLGKNYTDTERYTSLDAHPILHEYIAEYGNQENYPELAGRAIELKRGVWDFTVYGSIFIDCCYTASE